MTFDQLHAESLAIGERKDCAVKAVALAANIPYATAHAALKRKGRANRRTTPFPITQAALDDFGLRCEQVKVKARTVRTIERELRGGVYLIRVRAHVLCYRDGSVHDWTKGRLHRIREVNQVVPKI